MAALADREFRATLEQMKEACDGNMLRLRTTGDSEDS